MDSPDDLSATTGMTSHDEIVERFKKVFGREMTPSERHIFFLEYPPSAGEKATET